MITNWRSRSIRKELKIALEWLICDNGLPITILCSIIALNIDFILMIIEIISNNITTPSIPVITNLIDFISIERKYILLIFLTMLWMYAGINKSYFEDAIRYVMYSWLAKGIIKLLSIVISKGPLSPMLNFFNSVTLFKLCIISPEDLGRMLGIRTEESNVLLTIKLILIISFLIYMGTQAYMNKIIINHLKKHITVLPSNLSEGYKRLNIGLFLLFIPLYYIIRMDYISPFIFIVFLILLNIVNIRLLEEGMPMVVDNPKSELLDTTNKIELTRNVNPEIVYVDRQGKTRDLINVVTTLTNPNDIHEPIDIVILVDRSESMKNLDKSGEKRKESIKIFMKVLRESGSPRSRIGLIYFNNQSVTTLELGDSFRNAIKVEQLIDKMPGDEGATDYNLAFKEAINVLSRGDSKKANILFITDGIREEGYIYEGKIFEDCLSKGYRAIPIGIGVDNTYPVKPDLIRMAESTKGTYLFPPTINDLNETLSNLAKNLLLYKILLTDIEIVECLPTYLDIIGEPKLISPDPSRYPSSTFRVKKEGNRIRGTIEKLDGMKGSWSLSYSVELKTRFPMNCIKSEEYSNISFKEDDVKKENKFSTANITIRAYPGLIRWLLHIDSKSEPK